MDELPSNQTASLFTERSRRSDINLQQLSTHHTFDTREGCKGRDWKPGQRTAIAAARWRVNAFPGSRLIDICIDLNISVGGGRSMLWYLIKVPEALRLHQLQLCVDWCLIKGWLFRKCEFAFLSWQIRYVYGYGFMFQHKKTKGRAQFSCKQRLWWSYHCLRCRAEWHFGSVRCAYI